MRESDSPSLPPANEVMVRYVNERFFLRQPERVSPEKPQEQSQNMMPFIWTPSACDRWN